MRYRSVLSPGAKADISSAVRWYQLIDPNLAFRFSVEMLVIRRRIEQFPYQFPVIAGTIRRALLKHFPFDVFYSLNEDIASILAVVHQRRSNAIWLDRGDGRS